MTLHGRIKSAVCTLRRVQQQQKIYLNSMFFERLAIISILKTVSTKGNNTDLI
jgi:hypothetical protein